MSQTLNRELREKIEADAVETVGEHCFVPLLSLDSGDRFGLSLPAPALEDDEPTWAKVSGDKLVPFAGGSERHFVEVLEHSRSEFDELIERGAGEQGMSPDDAMFSFPAVDMVKAMLQTRSAHYCFLALKWLLPSELRALRDDIEPLSGDKSMPIHVRDLARRLLVPT